MQTCVNRKLSVTRWMNATTVRVVVSKAKAGKRAERSRRVRRRKRGQRVGRSRSRGGKPRLSCAPDPALFSHSKACRRLLHRGRMDDHLYKRSVLLIEKSVRPIIPLLTVRNFDPYQVRFWRRNKRAWEGLRLQYAKIGQYELTQTMRRMGEILREEEESEEIPGYDECGFGSPYVPQHLLQGMNAVPPPDYPRPKRRNRVQLRQHGSRRTVRCGPCGWVALVRVDSRSSTSVPVRCPKCGAVS